MLCYMCRTIWVPDVALELHGRRHERVVLGEFELCWEDAAFVWCSLGALDHGLPEEKVIFVDWACCDALGRVGGKVLVLLEEALGGHGVHGCGGYRLRGVILRMNVVFMARGVPWENVILNMCMR